MRLLRLLVKAKAPQNDSVAKNSYRTQAPPPHASTGNWELGTLPLLPPQKKVSKLPKQIYCGKG